MTTHTIGFSINLTQQNSQVHIAPHLFFQTSELSHLNWVNTIYPKHEDDAQAFSSASTQLANYVRYYQHDPKLIIGGDLTTLLGVCQGYDSMMNIYLFTDNLPELPFQDISFLSSLQQSLTKQSKVYTTKHLITTGLFEIKEAISINEQSIVCIDIPYLINNGFSILKRLSTQPNALLLTNYDPGCDEDKQIYNQLVEFIQRLTS